MADFNYLLHWHVPRVVGAVFFGVLLAGVAMPMALKALGYLPLWLPWVMVVGFSALAYIALRKVGRRRDPQR